MAALDTLLQALVGGKRDFNKGTDDSLNPPVATQVSAGDFRVPLEAAQAARQAWRDVFGQEHEDGAPQSATLVGDDADSRDNPTAFAVFRNEGLPNNPRFGLGNPYVAGVGLNAMGVWYTDDTLGEWLLCFSWEQSGTFASVLDGVRRSAFEAFAHHGAFKPLARLFEASSQMMQVTGWGLLVAPGGAVRSSGTLTLTTAEVSGAQPPHGLGTGQKLYKGSLPGFPGHIAELGEGELWGPGETEMTVASVVDPNTVTVADARADFTNTEWLSFTTEPASDVAWGRDSYGTFVVFTKNGPRLYVGESGPVVPSGLSLLSGGSALPLGAAGVASVEASADMLHVLEGKTFYNQGKYRSTGWYNGGGQTQTTQETFVVGTGSGNKTTDLPVIGADEWQVLRVVNEGEGASNTLQINAGPGNTIKGAASLTIPAYAAVTLTPVGTDWKVLYHPPPP